MIGETFRFLAKFRNSCPNLRNLRDLPKFHNSETSAEKLADFIFYFVGYLQVGLKKSVLMELLNSYQQDVLLNLR